MLEVMSIAVQARTVAVMVASIVLPTGLAPGTGTDCVAIAASQGEQKFCGLHTEIGEATGRAVYNAVLIGARNWMDSREGRHHAALG